MPEHDPLMTVSQIARDWGTGHQIVLTLIQSGALPSIDRGELIGEGHLDIPLIRRSWAESLRRDSKGSDRLLKPPPGEDTHPAAQVALDMHSALDRRAASEVWELSSKASRKRAPEALLQRWLAITGGGFPTTSGVGTAIYSLAPLPAVAARVFADAPKTPRAVEKATPATAIAVLPLVEEEGEWRVDLPLFDPDTSPESLIEVLTTPLPDEDQGGASPD